MSSADASGKADMNEQPTANQDILAALAQTIAGHRKEAVAGRAQSGIELFWDEDDAAYEGYDDANKHEFHDVKSKPNEGGRDVTPTKAKGSTLFPPITGPYVDAAAAKVSDMLLPTDERNFVVQPTTVPDLLDEEEGWPALTPTATPAPQAPPAPPAPPAAPMPAAGGAMAAMAAPQGNPAQQIMADPAAAAQPPVDPLKESFEQLKDMRQKALEAAKKTQDTIDDFLDECGYYDELRQIIHDAARIGTGVTKGPVPHKRKTQVFAKNPATGIREMVEKIETVPVSKRVDPRNAFPDPSCGESIHDGAYFFERDFFTAKKLAELKGGKGTARYLDDQISAAIEEGPDKRNETASPRLQNQQYGSDVFEVWYFYGQVTGKELMAAGCKCEDEAKTYPVIITMVNDRVIKAALNHIDSGEFPYDFLVWKKRPGMPWGSGVARAARTGQRMVTAGTRNLMDNAGASARPHKILTDAIEQDGDPWTWRATSEVQDVRGAMQFFIQPSLQAELMNVIMHGEHRIELDTGLPMIVLGMQGNVQETASGRALQNNNGSTALRRIARNFDAFTEAHIRRYYTWLQIYGDGDWDGDLQVKARGSSALVERDLQNQQMPALMQMSLNPAFEMDPKATRQEYLKSMRFDPDAFDMTEERKAELAKNAKPPVIPQIEVAKLREQGATQRKEMDLKADAQESNLDRALEERLAQLDAQLARDDLSAEERQAADKHKVALASLSMELRQQRELSPGPQVRTPPSEPAGRAPNGFAFPA
jgi:hypothetical protein